MSSMKPKLSNLSVVGNLSFNRRQAIESAKKNIFGYARGLPGEKQWLKPLQGKSFTNWYFPSRYLMPHFHIEHYLQMQANRFVPAEPHPSMKKLADCLNLILLNKDLIKSFLRNLDRNTFIENPTIQDVYSLYRTIDDEYTLNFAIDTKIWKPNNFSWFKMKAENGLMMLELQQKNSEEKISDFLKEFKAMSSLSELQDAIKEKLKKIPDLDAQHLIESNTCENIPTSKFSFETINGTPRKSKLSTKERHFMKLNLNISSTSKLQENSHEKLEAALDSDKQLRDIYMKRIRFFDPLFHRKRNAFLDKLSRNRIKSEKEKEKYAGKLYKLHPNLKEVWPENKGISSRQWPSPYH